MRVQSIFFEVDCLVALTVLIVLRGIDAGWSWPGQVAFHVLDSVLSVWVRVVVYHQWVGREGRLSHRDMLSTYSKVVIAYHAFTATGL